MTVARRIRVTGIVQGVGFRPFVWRLASELELSGWVRNDALGVEIAAEGAEAQVAKLLQRLRIDAPPLARVDAVESVDTVPDGSRGFAITGSAGGRANTAIGPDIAVCADCLAELFDRNGRRWRHAFITCTHCGPRYTVTRGLPYDRARTSLAPFSLCSACAVEYGRPDDRRFHAETTCCTHCGPRLRLMDAQCNLLPGDPIAETLALLRAGSIVAIKGLGGFHLACDAKNGEAVARLRKRKNREAKPFAVMAANAVSLAAYADLTEKERSVLESRERPVVVVRKCTGSEEALPGVAPGLIWLGAMLPTTPIHFLLFHEAAGQPAGCEWLTVPQGLVLVMTSANPGGEPIVRDDDEARVRLGGIADAFLEHDRDIVARCDDSVVRVIGDTAHFIRRSRGHAPAALRLPRKGPAVLALGAYLKNAICVTRGDEAFLSPHIGDLDNAATCNFLDETVARMLDLLEVQPDAVAHDRHPDYYSSRAAAEIATRLGLPLIPVQHHHAHIAAVCVEHTQQAPVLGLALDGVGLGDDNTAWGGELLLLDGKRFERLGHLRPLPLPGGDSAAREPWRMAASALNELGRSSEIPARCQVPGAATVADMLVRNLNCPPSSSMGRVFDAAAGLLGLSTRMKFEAEAAMLLEQAASRYIECAGWPLLKDQDWNIVQEASSGNRLDLLPALARLLNADDVDQAAAHFHGTLVAALADWIGQAASSQGISTVAWSGGCFINRLLSLGLREKLEQRGLRVLTPVRLPPGDGGIAVGQAWAAQQLLES
ncbi:MAG: carbamoyltransferase HypF [Sulfuritalea sp.]|nr:carbamoyltransferase HypF [Sulfuritalea sp.]